MMDMTAEMRKGLSVINSCTSVQQVPFALKYAFLLSKRMNSHKVCNQLYTVAANMKIHNLYMHHSTKALTSKEI